MRTQILVYVDDGAWFGPLLRALLHDIDPDQHELKAIGAYHILHDRDMFATARLLVMPGGADRPYCRALNGAGNTRIRHFVEQGGGYLGVCAGAYYATARIVWHAGQADEICAPRELAFFSGTAIGSIPALGRLYDQTKRSAAIPQLLLANGETVRAYYNGGPYFTADPGSSFETIARYADLPDQPAAIVATTIGKGLALLTGVHLEMSADELAADMDALTDGPAYQNLVTALQMTDAARRQLWRHALNRLGVATVNRDASPIRKAG